MKLLFEIKRFEDTDVITTSGVIKIGTYNGDCYRVREDGTYDHWIGNESQGAKQGPFEYRYENARQYSDLKPNTVYARYYDGTNFYLYECDEPGHNHQ